MQIGLKHSERPHQHLLVSAACKPTKATPDLCLERLETPCLRSDRHHPRSRCGPHSATMDADTKLLLLARNSHFSAASCKEASSQSWLLLYLQLCQSSSSLSISPVCAHPAWASNQGYRGSPVMRKLFDRLDVRADVLMSGLGEPKLGGVACAEGKPDRP